jgi:hypothetical protein
MAIEVFNRYENKYLIDAHTFEKLEHCLSDHMEPDAYNRNRETYSIMNVYYDTCDNQLIRTSLQKPRYKEKLRLRSYGTPNEMSPVYMEIKKKVSGLTNKRRSELSLPQARAFLSTGIMPAVDGHMNTQVLREVQYLMERNQVRPALYLAYDRRAYFGIGEHDLRVSFDRNIRSRRTELALEAGDYGVPLLGGDQWLMEVKSAQSIPLWLARLLSEHQVFPTSFSKYGAEYQRSLRSGRIMPRPSRAPSAEAVRRLVPAVT